MKELQGIQDYFNYTLSHNQSSRIRIFLDIKAALQALKNLNRCSTPQIMEKIIRCIENLKTKYTPIHFLWIPTHIDISRNEKADVVAKKSTVWRKIKRRSEKWKKYNLEYIVEKHKLESAKAIIKLAFEQKTLTL